MTGGGPVQEPEQSWPVGAGTTGRHHWPRNGQQEFELTSQQHSSETWNASHNHASSGRDEMIPAHNTLITLISSTTNPRKSPNIIATKTYDDFQQYHLYNNKLEDPKQVNSNNDNYCDFNSPSTMRSKRNEYKSNDNNQFSQQADLNANGNDDNGDDEDDDDDEESLSEALSAVVSAEEYAAKIFKLQQACLTPLKEDLADWLNKIMNLSTITSENFMHKLDNGVVICRLAKIISMWCEQQFSNQQLDNSQQEFTGLSQHSAISESNYPKSPTIHHPLSEISRTPASLNHAQNYPQKLSTSISNIHSQWNKNHQTNIMDSYNASPQESNPTSHTPTPVTTPTFRPRPKARVFTAHCGQLKSTSLSTNCIASLSSANSLSYLSTNAFLENLIKMIQTKIWDGAKCRTFYARDNVSNFLRWSRGFGVNQSVLFESDDLVLHANPRQVVLCLLDVARIACVKHGFTEAPGLVKFEQEIDRELAAEREAAAQAATCGGAAAKSVAQPDGLGKGSKPARGSTRQSNESATDELILRYCRHKEEEAARARAAQPLKEEQEVDHDESAAIFHQDSLIGSPDDKDSGTSTTTKSPIGESQSKGDTHLGYDYRVDSLDSGEGRTESASTCHSRTPVNNLSAQVKGQSAIPVSIKQQQQQQQRSESDSPISRASSVATSELSSSRSSLLSNQDSGTANSKRRLASSDLDGKVMRIAKSYYGKGARRGVTRLSEGKYRIADRIVFVRLLKGHRVMVRIGGGWDTLENFLFRHKSDPSQVIDVDNLLPLEAKMSFEKNPTSYTTTMAVGSVHKPNSRLPYLHQRRSSSASSTNLSTSVDLSVASPTIGGSISTAASTLSTGHAICTPVRRLNNRQESMPESVPLAASARQQTPYLLIHRGHQQQGQTKNFHASKHPATPHRANSVQSPSIATQARNVNPRKLSGPHIGNRPLGNSRTPTASSTNLFPATLITNRAAHSASRPFEHHSGGRLINGLSDRANVRKQEALRKLGRSSDSLQVSYLRTPRNYGNSTSATTTTSTTNYNGSQASRNSAINGAPNSAPRSLGKEAKC